VQDLLTFARQKEPQRSPTDVNEAIERTLALRSYELTVYNIEIVTELEENLPWTMADGYQLQQVFLNIVNNAYQAMSQQGGAGVLTVRSECIGEDTIRVTFSDTGPGIPPQVLTRIFDPFFTTKDVGMGTGLGLSVSHGIIQEHGGRIWAESDPGGGAVFVIELPVISWPEELSMPSFDKDTEDTTRGKKRILIVGGEQSVADLMVKALTDSGYYVDVVAGANSALRRLQRDRYDVIISDIMMPGMDGPAWEREIAALDPALAERIIFITGDALSPSLEPFAATRRGRCLRKPFTTEELGSAVRRILG
jgi:CheY-like chemotaxis protein